MEILGTNGRDSLCYRRLVGVIRKCETRQMELWLHRFVSKMKSHACSGCKTWKKQPADASNATARRCREVRATTLGLISRCWPRVQVSGNTGIQLNWSKYLVNYISIVSGYHQYMESSWYRRRTRICEK